MYSGKKTLADTEQQKSEKLSPERRGGRYIETGNKERGGQGYKENGEVVELFKAVGLVDKALLND